MANMSDVTQMFVPSCAASIMLLLCHEVCACPRARSRLRSLTMAPTGLTHSQYGDSIQQIGIHVDEPQS